MTRQTMLSVAGVCLLTAALLPAPASPADAPQAPPSEPRKDKPDKAPGADSDEVYRREAERLVSGIEVEVLNGDKWSALRRIDKPLLFYGDATRENDRGSVWAWGDGGRPLALLELFQNVTDRSKWVYTVCNTAGQRLRATRGGAPWWRANDSAAELRDVPGAPAPPVEAAARQRQLKLLAQRFTGHEFWDPNNSRYELRRLERPLHSYRDEAAGLLEGGLFTLANGTNPEVMLFVEARANPKDKAKAVWQFAVGRLSHAELHLEYDGKEVFSAPRGDRLSAPDKPYWLGLIDMARDSKPRKE